MIGTNKGDITGLQELKKWPDSDSRGLRRIEKTRSMSCTSRSDRHDSDHRYSAYSKAHKGRVIKVELKDSQVRANDGTTPTLPQWTSSWDIVEFRANAKGDRVNPRVVTLI